MKLSTIVLSPEGKPTNLVLEVVHTDNTYDGQSCRRFYLYDCDVIDHTQIDHTNARKNKMLGSLTLLNDGSNYIQSIVNNTKDSKTPYCHVGTALIECWLRIHPFC